MGLVFTDEDRARIGKAVEAAERGHRGEIVVHVEPRTFGDPLKRAAKLFTELGVDRTKEATGVLLYVTTSPRTAAVWAGRGVAGGAEAATWKPVFAALAAGKADPVTAICDAIVALGKVLERAAAGPDVHGNELADGVST